MSCILVALTSMYVSPGEIGLKTLAWLMVRDLSLLSVRIQLLVGAMRATAGPGTCLTSQNMIIYFCLDAAASALRLVKNPLQMLVNRRYTSNVLGGREAPAWTSLFKDTGIFCGGRLASYVDLLVYAALMFGSMTMVPVGLTCSPGFHESVARREIELTSWLYVICAATFAFVFVLNRLSLGRLLPGVRVHTSEWPETCPSLRLDMSMWRERNEDVEDYRGRVMDSFLVRHSLRHVEPIPLEQMTTNRPQGITPDILEQLRTFRYVAPETQTRPDEPTSGMIVVKDNMETVELDNSRSTDHTCVFCISEYQPGEMLRELPCRHWFHRDCIDVWLQGNIHCPVCNSDASKVI